MGRKLSHNGLVENQIKTKPPRKVYSWLLWIAQNRGFKPGWVKHKFHEIFGKWPRPTTPVEPEAPDTLLVEWLGIERKRFAARKRRMERREGAAFKSAEPAQFSGEGLDVA